MKLPIQFIAGFLMLESIVIAATPESQSTPQATSERDLQLKAEESFRMNAAQDAFYLNNIEAGRIDSVKELMADNMWRSIVDIDKMTRNPDASVEQQRNAKVILATLVEYFYRNPRTIQKPEASDVARRVDQEVKLKTETQHAGTEKDDVLNDLNKALKKPLRQLDGTLNTISLIIYKKDLETQEVLKRQIYQRNFPAIEYKGGGVTFLIPDSGSALSGDTLFKLTGKKLRISYKKDGALIVNDQQYGSLTEGDRVDLRLPGHLFVNDVERKPSNGDAKK